MGIEVGRLFGKVGAERGTTTENRVITVFEEAKKHHPRIPVVRIPPGSSDDYLFGECLSIVERERIKYLQERG